MAYAAVPTLDQVPLALEPEPGESPGSYCLRSVSAQGLNMHWLRRAAGLSYLAYPTRDDEQVISHVLGAPRGWLRDALPAKKREVNEAWSYQGQLLQAESYLRFKRPQVCGSCLHSRGYCLAIWDFSFVTHCLDHEEQLIDWCEACGRRLSWDRPAVDVCICGRAIRRGPRVCGQGRILSAAIDGHLRAVPLNAHALEENSMPGFLADLSLNGLLYVVHAFGELSGPLERRRSDSMTRMRTTIQWSAVLDRASERLRRYATTPLGVCRLSDEVSEGILKRLRRWPLNVADVQVARLLFRTLFGMVVPTDQFAPGQLELFP